MKIGIVGDAHLGCTDYSIKRRADFSTAFCSAIEICTAKKVDAICLLGDVFDSAATRRSVDAFAEILKEISPSLSRLKSANIPLIAIPGNHEFGRGREAGELTALECLGFLHVLRGTDFKIGPLRICGIPWQHDPAEVPKLVERFLETTHSGPQILLLHNFIRGSQSIPSDLWEVDPGCCTGFGKTFIGHHHIHEIVGSCVIPGSIEVQNMRDRSEKCVVIYDSQTNRIEKCRLPRTHRVVVLEYDITQLTVPDFLSELARELDSDGGSAEAFVYLRVYGTTRPNHGLSKAEILAVLRERDLFDYYIDLRYSTEARTAIEARRGASIEQILRRSFQGDDLATAKRYLTYVESERLFADIREDILCDHKKSKTR